MQEKREIERTCIACREKRPKNELERYVLSAVGKVIRDPEKDLPGRGAYLCGNEDCLKAAIKRNAFSRAFRGRADISALRAENG